MWKNLKRLCAYRFKAPHVNNGNANPFWRLGAQERYGNMKRTKKLALLLTFVLVFSTVVFSVSASASGGAGGPRTPTPAEYNALCRLVDTVNQTIETLVWVAQLTPYNDVPWLLASVDALTSAVFTFANLIGAEVVCELVEYYIDGQYVLIDPIWVIPPLPPEPVKKD